MKLSIVIPYRGRKPFLDVFLKGLTKYLHYKNNFTQDDFCVILAEQLDDHYFNRGLSINVGADYSIRHNLGDYFVFHDIDILPMSGIDYRYSDKPEWWFLCAGGFKMLASDFTAVNGFSNEYCGWGYEDTDFQKRLSFFSVHKKFWPITNKSNEPIMLNLEFGGKIPEEVWKLKSYNASQKYFSRIMEKNFSKWEGFPRFYAPKDVGMKGITVNKYRKWYEQDHIDQNKSRVYNFDSVFDTSEKVSEHYKSHGLNELPKYTIVDSNPIGNIHRVGFFSQFS